MGHDQVVTDADVIVVGSGGAGMMAALRSSALGLRTVIIEKARFYGGTTATSGGGLWIPNHGLPGLNDSAEQALTYLRQVTNGRVPEDRMEAFVHNGRQMVGFLRSEDMQFGILATVPDYYPELPGATKDRCLYVIGVHARDLDSNYYFMRSPNSGIILLNRYALNLGESGPLTRRLPGWQLVAAKIILRYWLDIGGRLKSRRDRLAPRGDGLISNLLQRLLKRNVPILLNTALTEIHMSDGRATGVTVRSDGSERILNAHRGIILAAGGYEQSQALRDKYYPVKTDARWSLTPPGANRGDALAAAIALGADTDFMDCAWWVPIIQLPSKELPNVEVPWGMFFDQRHPNSIIVNRNGVRFANESISYDRFGIEMVDDDKKTGANNPCWMVFDTTYREKYTCGGILPKFVFPDALIPPHWWDNYLFRASSVRELAVKMQVPAEALEESVRRMNAFAASGTDSDFGRGGDDYGRFWGDPNVRPNPCLGPIDKPPYYAVRLQLGDIGTKGGLKADANARVLKTDGKPIDGLYVAGNNSASVFGNAYPGPGGTIGAALTFGFVAANHIAQSN